ncbi:hypothetical protein MTO96_045904 [Rhipicephalus appendiculatus]
MAARGLRSSSNFRLAVVLLLAVSTAHQVEARSAHVASHVVHEPLFAVRQAGAPSSAVADSLAPTTTELTEEFDDDDDGGAAVAANASPGGVGGAANDADEEDEASPVEEQEEEASSTTTAPSTREASVAPTRPSLSNAYPPVRVSTPKVETEPPRWCLLLLHRRDQGGPRRRIRRPHSPGRTTPRARVVRTSTRASALNCPARFPATSRRSPRARTSVTTRCSAMHSRVSNITGSTSSCSTAASCPPSPNGLFHNVDVEWMEVLNSTVQFQKNFFTCSKDCL